ncbi:uncharacterized protein PHACADRAFT_262855, partial [Phanerochaete carnosa HHB-10118-sp]
MLATLVNPPADFGRIYARRGQLSPPNALARTSGSHRFSITSRISTRWSTCLTFEAGALDHVYQSRSTQVPEEAEAFLTLFKMLSCSAEKLVPEGEKVTWYSCARLSLR